jgi:hypothetical protein
VFLPADQAKYGHAEGKQSHNDSWDCEAKLGQAIEKKEQNQAPGSNRTRHSHFHSPLGKRFSLPGRRLYLRKYSLHAKKANNAQEPPKKGQYRTNLPEHISVKRRDEGSQAIPDKKQSNTPSTKRSHFTLSF